MSSYGLELSCDLWTHLSPGGRHSSPDLSLEFDAFVSTHAINTQTWVPEVEGAMGRWDATIGPLILALTKPTEWAQHSWANRAASVPTRLGLNVKDMQATHKHGMLRCRDVPL